MEDERYSLLDEPWIRCTTTAKTEETMSLRELFEGKHAVASILGESPAQDYAILRMVLAIFWRAYHRTIDVKPGSTFDMGEWWEEMRDEVVSTEPETVVLEYLEEFRDRFYLFGPEKPFMQVADLHTNSGNTSEIRRIVPEAENSYFTMRAGEESQKLSIAEAARWLVHAQAFDYSGIKSGAVGDPRVKGGKGYPIGTGWSGMTGGTVIVGATLRETLLLNTTADALRNPDDRPVWEREPDSAAERKNPHPQGPSDFATWQSRKIRLYSENEEVREVLVANGDKIPEAGANLLGDPMTPYRFSKNKSVRGKTVYYPRPYDAERMVWRSLEALIVLEGDPGYEEKNIPPIRPKVLSQLAQLAESLDDAPEWANLHLVSVGYGPQSSTVANTITAALEIPVALLKENTGPQRRVILDDAQAASDAGRLIGIFAGQLLQAAGGTYEFHADATDRLLAALQPRFQHVLANLDLTNLTEQSKNWQNFIRTETLREAHTILAGAGPAALIGREDPSTGRILNAGTVLRSLYNGLQKALPLLSEDDASTDKEPQPQ